jgi:hypothetical protein
MNEKFKHIIDTPSPVVDAIVDKAMFHTRKEDARRFLYFMDSYICYYLNKDNNELCFPIIRVPSCPIWAREVFLKYLILRLSIYYNQDSLSNLKPEQSLHMMYVDPYDSVKAREARKHNTYISKWNSFKRTIATLNKEKNYIGENNHKNLIFCTPNDLMVSRENKNEFIKEFYGEPDDIFTQKNVCICHDMTSKDIRQRIKEEKSEVYIDNIFVFFTNNDQCKSLRKANIEKLNRSRNTGIKNCFVFDFTDHPYRLAETLNKDKRMSFIYPGYGEKEYQYNDNYTCLTDEETQYIFKPQIKESGISQHRHISDNEMWHNNYFIPLIANFTDNAEYWVQERNTFSLCLSENLSATYKQRLKSFTTDTDEHIFDESFEVQKTFAEKIKREILTRLDGKDDVDRIALVVDYFTPDQMKSELKNLFEPYITNVYSYNHLRPMRIGNKHLLGNKLKEKYVFVLRYRPHNSKSVFANYPNSFDPFTTNPGQYVIEIIQDYIFIDKFIWDKYDYELEQYKFLNSVYRREIMGGFDKPVKPNSDDYPRISGDDDPNEERNTNRQTVAMVDITYENGRPSRIAESEWVIYQTQDDYMGISRLKDLKEDDVVNQVIAVQRLSEISDELSKTIIEREREGTEQEKITRNSYYTQGIITLEERDSDTFLWKILLWKKVGQKSPIQVYDEIMATLKESDKVQFNAFLRWIDKSNSMMLPLQKATQKRLMEYLGLSPAYLQVMRSKKMTEINKTRKNNNMLDSFLADYLLTDIDEDTFEDFKNAPINEILRYERISDLKALVELLNENINLKKVVSIQ